MSGMHLLSTVCFKRCTDAVGNYSIAPRLRLSLILTFLTAFALVLSVEAQGTTFTYQGHLADGGVGADGSYDLNFSVWDSAGGGSQIGGGITQLGVPVASGLFAVSLDFGGGIFTGPDRWLQINVQTNGGGGYTTLAPRTAMTPTPYAILAGFANGVAGGSIGSFEVDNNSLSSDDLAPNSVGVSELAADSVSASELQLGSVSTDEVLDDSLTAADLAPNSVGSSELADNAVGSAELADDIDLGSSTIDGRLDVFNTSAGTASVSLIGGSSRISTYGSDGLEQIRLWGPSWGEILLYNSAVENAQAVRLSANGIGGGALFLQNTNSANRAILSGLNSGGTLRLYAEDGSSGIFIDGDGTGSAGEITVSEADGSAGVSIQATSGGRVDVNDSNGQIAARLAASGAFGGYQYLYNRNGALTVLVDGDSGSGGYLSVRNTNGSSRVVLDGYGVSGGGTAYLYATDGSQTIALHGEYGGAGVIEVDDSVSQTRVRIDGESTGTGGEISVYDNDGTETVQIRGAEASTQGGEIALSKADGTTTITLDADFNGDGRITTQELEITGGSDLSEQFDIDGLLHSVKPGMIVCIDAANPGKLAVSSQAYDRTVAGVVSGAGGVKPGLLMGQAGSVADGEHAVALSGRVYCMVDASQGSIEPGDLITTSTLPGHGMRVSDYSQAYGAVIGKAMTSLADGQGLVLVLVSLH